MPYFCGVKGCGNKVCLTKNNPNIAYHRFPNDPERLTEWIRFCGWHEGWQPQRNQGICSIHFDDSCYDERYKIRSEVIGAKFRRQLKVDAIPGDGTSFGIFDYSNNYCKSSKRRRLQASAMTRKKKTSTENIEITTIKDSSDEDEVEGKMCKICQSALLPEAKYLLQHALDGKSYKDIIQETLNVPVFYDDDENMRICEKCSNFIEDLSSFVKLCRENLAKIIVKRPLQKKVEIQLSEEEEDCYDYDTASLEEEIPDSNPDEKESIIQDISIIHELRNETNETMRTEMLDPLHIDMGPSSTSDPNVSKITNSDEPFALIEPTQLTTQEYTCKHCDFQTDQQEYLLLHVRDMHTDKRPYGCTVCSSTFSNAVNHCLHFQQHKTKGEAKVHVIKCVYCGILITKATVFERHLANTHPGEAVTV